MRGELFTMDFTGEVAVVTGGASGIGLACCVEFLENHAAVALVDSDEKTGERARDELSRLGGRIEFFHLAYCPTFVSGRNQ
jgi:NAD(P)-dependent dehydrogenase (short-subunit alcohol dehydrogenase family)